MSTLAKLRSKKNYKLGFLTQLKLLVLRSMKQRQGEKLTKVSLLVSTHTTFFTCIFWFRLPDSTGRIYERSSLLLFIIIAQSIRIVTEGVSVFQRERFLLSRERAKKLYTLLPTRSQICPSPFFCLVYTEQLLWATNLLPTAAVFFTYMLVLYLTVSTAQSTGLFLSIAIPNLQISLMLAPLVTLVLTILGGFYIPLQNTNPAIAWASWISMTRYGYSGFLDNEFKERSIPCSSASTSLSFGDSCPLLGDDAIAGFVIYGIVANVWVNIGFLSVMQLFLRYVQIEERQYSSKVQIKHNSDKT